MNKQELVNAIAAKTGESKKTVAAIIGAMTDVVPGAVASGDKVIIPGFGAWERKFREGGERRNPQGGTVHVASKHVPAFKAGSGFKATVSGTAA